MTRRNTPSITLAGDKRLIRKLNKLRIASARNVVRGAMRPAAKPMNVKAKANAKKIMRTGDLWKSIGIRVETLSRIKGDIVCRIGPRKGFKAHRYAHLVHEGTQPHNIATKSAASLQINGEQVGLAVNHPGARGNPFLREAFESKGDESKKLFIKKALERFKKEAAKGASRKR